MSMNSALKARLERLAPVQDISRDDSCFGEKVPVALRRDGGLYEPISIARKLHAAGATMRSAHTAITRLADDGLAVCEIGSAADLDILAADLQTMNVHVIREH